MTLIIMDYNTNKMIYFPCYLFEFPISMCKLLTSVSNCNDVYFKLPKHM